MKTVTIRQVLNGFVVVVGCAEIVFQGKIELLAQELVRYQQNPDEVEKEYRDKSINPSPPLLAIGNPLIPSQMLYVHSDGSVRSGG